MNNKITALRKISDRIISVSKLEAELRPEFNADEIAKLLNEFDKETVVDAFSLVLFTQIGMSQTNLSSRESIDYE